MANQVPDLTIHTKEGVDSEALSKRIPRYHVVLLDDNDHTYEYVVEMLTKIFCHSRTAAWRMAREEIVKSVQSCIRRIESRLSLSVVKYMTTGPIGVCRVAKERCLLLWSSLSKMD